MNLPRFLNKPEYVRRPQQVIRRLWLTTPFARQKGNLLCTLSWGLVIRFDPNEAIGRAILHHGILDLVVTETIFRLLEDGETAVDIGANIGHMTGAMAKASGPHGRVMSFEPSPKVFGALLDNVSRWRNDAALALISVQQCAVSNKSGPAVLYLPPESIANQGLASLEGANGGDKIETVQCVVLDEIFGPGCQIGLIKIDVEGHEFSVLTGAERLLREKRIRDIIFEEHRQYPSPVHKLLKAHEYALYRLSRDLSHVQLCRPDDRRTSHEHPFGVQNNFLATSDSRRAETRLRSTKWVALRG